MKGKQPANLKDKLSPYNQQKLKDELKTLQQINAEIGELKRVHEELTKNIMKRIGHNVEGERTYIIDDLKFTAKTPLVWSLDKKLYAELRVNEISEQPFVKESIKYDLNVELCRNPSADIADLVDKLVTCKEGKMSITKIGHIS